MMLPRLSTIEGRTDKWPTYYRVISMSTTPVFEGFVTRCGRRGSGWWSW